MANITVSVPEELKRKMELLRIMNWSEVAREAFMQKVADLEFLREFKSKSDMTQEDALRLGRKVNKSLAEKFGIKRGK